MGANDLKIAVVIPCYKVKNHILEVLAGIGPEVSTIYIVDDACPDGSGKFVQMNSKDKRLKFIFHEENQGVGGAVISGYKAALADSAGIVVKMDGDGQMLGSEIPRLLHPILEGRADYSKGNRFDNLEDLRDMPFVRVLGNAMLSLLTKISSGYWTINDPTNGFTAVKSETLIKLSLNKLSRSYFFESDLLFRLYLVGSVVSDVSMEARYGDEVSNLKIGRVLVEFPIKHARNLVKRVFYKYFLREWSVASIELPVGAGLASFGIWFGLDSYIAASAAGQATSAGQVTVSALGIILGMQLLLSFLSYDIQSEPSTRGSRR